MEILEEVRAWVVDQVGTAAMDSCGHQPGSLGLFPLGLQQLRKWEDVTGQKKRSVRYQFLLRLVAPPGEAAAALLLRLQQEAPRAALCAADGKLVKLGSDGLGIYDVRLSAEREETI